MVKIVTFKFSIPTPSGEMDFEVEEGTSLLFVGANGGGKTKLAVRIEDVLGANAHRISAHRALNLNPGIAKVSERIAILALRTGYPREDATLNHRIGQRWGSAPATQMLNDYDFVLQALFAEQANTSLETHKNSRDGNGVVARSTKFEQLIEIWDRILPHRKLNITADDIRVSVTGAIDTYPAAEMSDGERAIFYLIGQTLLAASNNLIIFDEPELHIHRSIMSRLWDELEAARPDCAMVFITHDLEFVASREGQKLVLREYTPAAGWTVESVPEDTGFSEELTTLILGSRKPILFVEGGVGSLDKAIFRACYPQWTVIPRGSCEEVIHSVVTMRANASFTRVTCSGIVDADAYDESERQFLANKGIEILPVSEIENIFLLPSVAEAIARFEGFSGEALHEKLLNAYRELFDQAADPKHQEPVIARYCKRRIDRILKKIDLSGESDVAAIAQAYADQTSSLDVTSVAGMAQTSIAEGLAAHDPAAVLRWFDNKGIMAIACKIKGTTKAQFEQWIVRALYNNTAPDVSAAIKEILPNIQAA
ncbi:AAA family ATPase [Mesorhizobium sp. RCC_202]|uniref:AAA family ATPase n=1 Tax=Mesorhizobium sp. RCC_202 TaxID=3239222 RepID=UPI003524A3EF